MAEKGKGFAEQVREIHEKVVGEGHGHEILVYPIDETGKTAVFQIDFEEEMGKPAQFVNIQSTQACTLDVKYLGTNWVPYPKGLQANVPLLFNGGGPVVRAFKITPSASANITGIATTPKVPIREGGM